MTKRTSIPALFAALCAAGAVGCSSEPEPKPDTGAPATTYRMVPATTGGGATPDAGPASPATTPSASPSRNPASPGSD